MTQTGLGLLIIMAAFVGLAIAFRSIRWQSPAVVIMAAVLVPIAIIAGVALILAPAVPAFTVVHEGKAQ